MGEDPYLRIFGRFSCPFLRTLGGAKPVEIPSNEVSFHCKGVLMAHGGLPISK